MLTVDARLALHEWLTQEMAFDFCAERNQYRHRRVGVSVTAQIVRGAIPHLDPADIRAAIVEAVQRARDRGGHVEPVFERATSN